ncbi:SDR family oxidoreductase [Hymenobacter taeanensis]|uniref:SDR family oxidoreductase n=1 Tax=Hymenobacter taeanensis TaxID=2735321 RepID=A0A6M6BJX2_9BACT|nr:MULTISPECIES: SDR family oxidoreductase [Hymenobacter]QJX48352.1 SDR family oxidoreductase [Hymenobacter taeanensis]UOQ82156.1 SDR family oxidoreductase [Hymenobacter sp. 5414T-23]
MSTDLLTGTKALITGGSSGLGFAMAQALADAGATVLITARSPATLTEAQARLGHTAGRVHTLPMDVRDEHSIAQAVQWVQDYWGGLDLLVNNAGIGMRTVNPEFMTAPQPFYKVSAAGFRDLLDTNLTGYFLVAKAFAPMMVAQGHGKIVNISMNHETMRRQGFIPYGPSRAGAESLSLIMAEDLRKHTIDVNMLLPGGATATGMIPEEQRAALPSHFSLLSPSVMARPIVFLASEASNGITGQRIVATEFDAWLTQQQA